MRSKQIFKEFPEKIAYLIYPDNPTFHEHNDVQGTKVYQSLKEILKNLTSGGKKETSVTAASIIAKLFKFNHALLAMRYPIKVEIWRIGKRKEENL